MSIETIMDAFRFIAIALLSAALVDCASQPVVQPAPPPAPMPLFTQTGLASWYGPHFSRRRTADGERFNLNAFTAAHRTLPLGTTVRVTNLENGRAVVVRITDRGPYYSDRILDLSPKAADALGMKHDGIVRVRLDELPADEAQVVSPN